MNNTTKVLTAVALLALGAFATPVANADVGQFGTVVDTFNVDGVHPLFTAFTGTTDGITLTTAFKFVDGNGNGAFDSDETAYLAPVAAAATSASPTPTSATRTPSWVSPPSQLRS